MEEFMEEEEEEERAVMFEAIWRANEQLFFPLQITFSLSYDSRISLIETMR